MKQITNDRFFARVEAEISDGRRVRFRIKGHSMRPLLRDGKDEVVLAPCRAEEVKRRDVVLFRYRGRHLLHRVIGKTGGRYRMQGDGICTSYEECGPEDIIGVVMTVYRPGGRCMETASVRWRLSSCLWLALGRFRGIALRILSFNKFSPLKYLSKYKE